MEPLVEIKNLSIRFPEGNSTFEAVKGISFSIGKGEIVGVVGESGSGKSMSALALMGLLPKDAEIASGSLCFQGEDLVTMKPETAMRQQNGDGLSGADDLLKSGIENRTAGRGKPADPYETRKC